ncbi:hypothetical protein AAVH_05843 [Aphelenchoides avenae]|nr:hypothetical protein AAVH_05843 [Aphelenchus avenae]
MRTLLFFTLAFLNVVEGEFLEVTGILHCSKHTGTQRNGHFVTTLVQESRVIGNSTTPEDNPFTVIGKPRTSPKTVTLEIYSDCPAAPQPKTISIDQRGEVDIGVLEV